MTAGAIAMGYAIAAIFFLRFWRDSGDRLFGFFALAFLVLAVNRTGVVAWAFGALHAEHAYWVRFAAFFSILLAIIDKNRSRA